MLTHPFPSTLPIPGASIMPPPPHTPDEAAIKVFHKIQEALTEILDVDPEAITPETYMVRDLDAESIDLLELSVALNAAFHVEINDDDVFLRPLRLCLIEAEESGTAPADVIRARFPFLDEARTLEILEDLQGGPVLKVKDLAAYVSRQLAGGGNALL